MATSQQETDYLTFRDMIVKCQINYVGPGKLMLFGDSIIECLVPTISTLKGSRFLGAGYGGASLSDIRGLATSLISAAQPSKIIIHIGANDILQWQSGFSSTIFSSNLAAFVAAIRQQTSAPLVVSTILPWGRTAEHNANLPLVYNGVTYTAKTIIDATNVEIRNRAMSLSLGLIDANAAMSGSDGYANPALFLPDGLHPNAAGIEVLRPLFEAAA